MTSIRDIYSTTGIENYYKEYPDEYSNPHETYIHELIKQVNIKGHILDLSCGNGSASLAIKKSLSSQDYDYSIIGCDPFLYEQYKTRTGNPCLKFSFDDIINGTLQSYQFDSIICSFALHLCEKSKLNTLLYQLSRISDELIILTPHKRPKVNPDFWKLTYTNKIEKVTLKKYESTIKKTLK